MAAAKTPNPDAYGRLRVRDNDTGHEYSVPADRLDLEAMTVLDRPATDATGEPIPVKYRVTKGGQSATIPKEQ